jgi:hypothetical protein
MNAVPPRNDENLERFKYLNNTNPPIPANSKWSSWAKRPLMNRTLRIIAGKYSLLMKVKASAVGIPEKIQGCHKGNSPVSEYTFSKAIPADFGFIVSGDPNTCPWKMT